MKREQLPYLNIQMIGGLQWSLQDPVENLLRKILYLVQQQDVRLL